MARFRLFRSLGVLLTIGGLAGACTKLGVLNTVMPKDRGAARVAEGLAYGDHPRQKLDIYAPVNSAAQGGKAAPVLVFFYGGSWDSGRRQDYGFVGHAFAARGFVTVIADYRLVPEVRYPAFVEDSAAVVHWTHRHIVAHGGDPDALVVAGHSAGAYNALMLATDPAYTTSAEAPPLPIDAAAGLAGPYDFLPLDVQATRRAFAGVADLARTQPAKIVTGQEPPLFLATGEADTTVRPRNTAALAEAARQAGRPIRTERYTDLGHAGILLALSRPFRGKAPVLDDLITFFRNSLKENSLSDGGAKNRQTATKKPKSRN